jgi:hypothetical protein
MADDKRHWVRDAIDWARRGHWIWTVFPAGSKVWLPGAVVAVTTAGLSLLKGTPLPVLFIYSLSAVVIYALGWFAVQRLAKQPSDLIDAEIYHVAVSPRNIAYPLIRDAYRIAGHPENATIDCDVLVKLYIVNKANSTKFIRDFSASVHIGADEVILERKDDLHADDFDGKPFDYGIRLDKSSQVIEIPYLYKALPFALEPQEPVDGWLRFVAKDILPDSIDNNTWKFAIKDSVGKDHPITKVSTAKHHGEIGVRRLRN